MGLKVQIPHAVSTDPVGGEGLLPVIRMNTEVPYLAFPNASAGILVYFVIAS
jgi:hypothetical protein